MVFEFFDTPPENNRALLGGGRYDNLLELFDDERVPGVGFGMGDVTITDFLEVRHMLPEYAPPTKVYVAVAAAPLVSEAMKLANELRRQGVSVATDFGERKLGKQIEAASKHNIPYLLVVGEDEVASGSFKIKNMVTGEEKKLSREELSQFFLNL